MELERGIPIFIDQLLDLFIRTEKGQTDEIGKVASGYGAKVFRLGFTVSRVVQRYGALCQVVTKLAGQLNVSITPQDFEVLNRSLDVAIAEAVTEYQNQRDQEETQEKVDRILKLAHELGKALAKFTIS